MMRRRQQGLSLIELMVALTIGLFLVSGILYIYLSTRASYASNDAAARVQEDARFAMERLTREIRMAGHTGCANTLDIQPNVVAGCVSVFPLGGGIQVFANGSGWTNPTTITRVAGTDVITLRGVRQECSTRVAAGANPAAGPIQIASNPCGWGANTRLVISDCTGSDIFAATGVTGTPTTAGNITLGSSLSKQYGIDALVWQYSEKTYFIGLHPTVGEPMLYEIDFDGVSSTVSDVVGNVYNMTILLNLDTNADGFVDSVNVSPAGFSAWNQVSSVTLTFDVRSEDATSGTTAASYTFNGAAVSDRRIRRNYVTTIGIRNRLP